MYNTTALEFSEINDFYSNVKKQIWVQQSHTGIYKTISTNDAKCTNSVM
jgi:hypothetical protein